MLREVYNPEHRKALEHDPTLGTPLFDGANERRVPPKTVKRSEARLETFKQISNDGTLNASRKKILSLIKRHEKYLRTLPCGGVEAPEIFGTTIIDLRDRYGIPLNVGSGRCSDLYRLGYIDLIGKKINPGTGRSTSVYKFLHE